MTTELFALEPASEPASATRERDRILRQLERKAGKAKIRRARERVAELLQRNGKMSGEAITAGCRAAGISGEDDRWMGCVLASMSRDGLIEICGSCKRERGHGTSGGNLWRIKTQPRN